MTHATYIVKTRRDALDKTIQKLKIYRFSKFSEILVLRLRTTHRHEQSVIGQPPGTLWPSVQIPSTASRMHQSRKGSARFGPPGTTNDGRVPRPICGT